MNKKFAIINNGIVENISTASIEFGMSQGWIICPDNVEINWQYINNQFIAPIPFDYSNNNKLQSELLLKNTDWTATIDVSDPQYSNPYLANQTEFLQYRSEVRKIAINPPSEEAIFPQIPTEVWQTI